MIDILRNLALFFFPKQNKVEEISASTEEQTPFISKADTDEESIYQEKGNYAANSDLEAAIQAATDALNTYIEQKAFEYSAENENTPNDEESDDNYLEDQPENEESSLSNNVLEIIAKLLNNEDYAQSSDLELLIEALPIQEFQQEIIAKLAKNPDYPCSSEIDNQQLFSFPSGQCDDLDAYS